MARVGNQVRRAGGAPRWFALLVVPAALVFPQGGVAATISPDTRVDDSTNNGNCTLREAVIAANNDAARDACPAGDGSDVISLQNGTYNLSLGQMNVSDPQGDALVIFGSGKGSTVAVPPAAPASRILSTDSALVLAGFTLTGGDAGTGSGGAVLGNASAHVQLASMLLTGNSAGDRGGAVHTSGALTLRNTTVAGNSLTTVTGGGGGGISADGSLTIDRSTIVGNDATSGDASATGGGLSYGAGGVALSGSVVDSNSSGGGEEQCSGPAATSNGFNVITNEAGCSISSVPSDDPADPNLAALADNGGPVRTMAVDPNGSAADLGPFGAACTSLNDARGAPRGQNGSGSCDAGAYETTFCGAQAVNSLGSATDDFLSAPPSPLVSLGLEGADYLLGGGAADALCGNGGEDRIRGNGGADLIDGGPGVDAVDYGNAAGPVAVFFDGIANDGEAGENDTLLSIESVVGGDFGDLIVADNARNGVLGGPGNDQIAGLGEADSLEGQAGNDTISGGGDADLLGGGDGNDSLSGEDGGDKLDGGKANDDLDGGPGADRLAGGDGNDTLTGGDGKDSLDGGGGKDKLDGGGDNDYLDGGPGKDVLVGGDGNDTLVGGPSKDKIRCGGGRDKVIADKKDKVSRDCEKVKRRR